MYQELLLLETISGEIGWGYKWVGEVLMGLGSYLVLTE